MTLANISINRRCVIQQLPPTLLLESLGLREGLTVALLSRQPMDGPVVVQIGRRCIAIARDIASQIIVQEEA